jgi:hypothetical protein
MGQVCIALLAEVLIDYPEEDARVSYGDLE